jgi:hypothetical protein
MALTASEIKDLLSAHPNISEDPTSTCDGTTEEKHEGVVCTFGDHAGGGPVHFIRKTMAARDQHSLFHEYAVGICLNHMTERRPDMSRHFVHTYGLYSKKDKRLLPDDASPTYEQYLAEPATFELWTQWLPGKTLEEALHAGLTWTQFLHILLQVFLILFSVPDLSHNDLTQGNLWLVDTYFKAEVIRYDLYTESLYTVVLTDYSRAQLTGCHGAGGPLFADSYALANMIYTVASGHYKETTLANKAYQVIESIREDGEIHTDRFRDTNLDRLFVAVKEAQRTLAGEANPDRWSSVVSRSPPATSGQHSEGPAPLTTFTTGSDHAEPDTGRRGADQRPGRHV